MKVWLNLNAVGLRASRWCRLHWILWRWWWKIIKWWITIFWWDVCEVALGSCVPKFLANLTLRFSFTWSSVSWLRRLQTLLWLIDCLAWGTFGGNKEFGFCTKIWGNGGKPLVRQLMSCYVYRMEKTKKVSQWCSVVVLELACILIWV